jgi:hypothetical protein
MGLRSPTTARIPAKPAGTTLLTKSGAPARLSGRGEWLCSTCRKAVPKTEVLDGRAKLDADTLTCAECLALPKKEARSHRARILQRRLIWILCAIALAATAVTAVFAPGLLLMSIALFGSAVCLLALLDSERRGWVRILLFCVGSAACATGFMQERSLKSAGREQSDYARFAPDVAGVRQLLKEDRYSDALKSFERWNAQTYAAPGKFASAGTERAFNEAASAFGEWIDAHFPGVTTLERKVLERLLADHSAKTASGSQRFSRRRSETPGLALKAFVDADPSDRNNVIERANELVGEAFGVLTPSANMELELWVCAPDGKESSFGTFRCTAEGLDLSSCAAQGSCSN